MALNLSKNHDSLVNAWKDVVDDKSSTNWAVFGYEGQTNTLHVVATGDGSLEEMAENLSAGKCMYALCHVKDPKTTLRKNVLIIWQGEGAPDTRKGVCANHVRPIADLLKGTHVTFTARTDDEVEPEFIMEKVIKASSSKFDFDTSHRGVSPPPGPVASVYKKIDPSLILKERDEYLQNQQREDMEERHRVEHQRRKSQQEELQQITRNRQASIEEEGEKRASQTPINTTNNPVAAALESKNYVNLQRKNWEEAQKTANVKPQLEKKPVRPFVAPTPAPPKPPHQMQKPAGFGPKGTLTPRVVLAPKKFNDPDAKAREEEERRRWEQSQKESENEEKERRLKAEQMRQERLKEVQALVSARRQSEDLTDEYSHTKTRTVSQGSENKSRTSSSSVAVAVDNDVAMQAYRDEERRKFEQQQRESEKDEQERRHRSESLRQERLRELAALTQSKDAAKDNFSALGQTVKENRGRGKKGEDPDLLARREEEKRRFEEVQREAQEEDNERKNKAEMIRQQRAQEAAALVAHRTSSAKAAFLEKTSPKEEQPPSTFESRQRSGSAQQAARALFEHSSAAQHQHTVSHVPSKVPLTPQTSQSSIGQEQPEMSPTDTDYIHPSQRALPPLPHEHNGHSNGRRDSGDRYERQTSGHEQMKHEHYETNGHNGSHQEPEHHHVANKTQVRDTEEKPDNVQVSPTHAVNAWKQGLPVRPPSDDEHEHDEEAWNEPEKPHHGVISPSLSSTSSSGQSQGLHARALYDYQAADETEISFDPGDIITHVDKIDPGWYQGMAPSGAFGLFPANYVEMLT